MEDASLPSKQGVAGSIPAGRAISLFKFSTLCDFQPRLFEAKLYQNCIKTTVQLARSVSKPCSSPA